MRGRYSVLRLLADLPGTLQVTHAEALAFVEAHTLFGIGLSLLDAHLLAALRLSPSERLWTGDRRLRAAADRLGVSADLRYVPTT